MIKYGVVATICFTMACGGNSGEFTASVADSGNLANDAGEAGQTVDGAVVVDDAGSQEATVNDSGTIVDSGVCDAASTCPTDNKTCGNITYNACGTKETCGCANPAFKCGAPDLNVNAPDPNQCGLNCIPFNGQNQCVTGVFPWICPTTPELQAFVNSSGFHPRYNCAFLKVYGNSEIFCCQP